jgi:hypothetical protein
LMTSSVSCISGSPATSNSISMTVTSCTNQPPIIANQLFSIAENSPNSSLVGQVIASDPNAGQALTYTISSGNSNGAFAVNALSGQITVANSIALNYELIGSFLIAVKAQDNGPGNLYSTANMTISLTNVNEPPIVQNQSFNVANRPSNGTVVGTVLASDPDAGQILNYSVTAGNISNAFSINSLTGVITVQNRYAVKYSTNPVFYLNVVVKDNAAVQLSSSATITINVLNYYSSEVFGFTIDSTDIEGGSEDQYLSGIMKIYPNPVIEGTLYCQVSSEVNEPFDISIFDMSGKLLSKRHIESGDRTITLDVTSYPRATYVVKLHSNKCVLTGKFIKN